MSRKALPCKACVERSDYFCAARRHKNNDIISGCRKKPEAFFDSLRKAALRAAFLFTYIHSSSGFPVKHITVWERTTTFPVSSVISAEQNASFPPMRSTRPTAVRVLPADAAAR